MLAARKALFGIQRKSPSGGVIGYHEALSTRSAGPIVSTMVPFGSLVVTRLVGLPDASVPAITSAPSTATGTLALPLSPASTLPRWICLIQLKIGRAHV